MSTLTRRHANAMGALIDAALDVAGVMADSLSIEAVNAINEALAGGARINVTVALAGSPCVTCHLVWPDGREQTEVFRMVATPDNKTHQVH